MKTILLVEDNPDILENTAELLEIVGYRIHTAKNGLEGIAEAKRIRPDLILCDIVMPEADGYEVLRQLKGNRDTSDIPLVFISASVEQKDVDAAMGRGASGYLRKPFETTELLKLVETIMGLYRRDSGS